MDGHTLFINPKKDLADNQIINIKTTEDKKFTISTVECLGACEQAPCMMVNFDYFGDLDKGKIDKILDNLN